MIDSALGCVIWFQLPTLERSMAMYRSCLIGVALALLTSTTANAASVTYTFDQSGASADLTPFDTTLGTLTGVTLNLTGQANLVGLILNSGSSDAVVSFTTSTYGEFGVSTGASGSGTVDALVAGPYSVPSEGGLGSLNVQPSATSNISFLLNAADFSSGQSNFAFVADFVASLPALTGSNPDVSIGSLSPEITELSGAITYTYGMAATPEPTTWTMMIAGFGLVGAAMRSRRKVTVRYA